MRKPTILAVDDDPEVLSAVERDLRKRYAVRFRVVRAEGPESALEAVAELKARHEAVALIVSDQRMPKMTGVEFLEQARETYPNSKRVLLTAYADTEAAIQAINSAKVDYYLSKPWEPPEACLYPILDDLLRDWELEYIPPFEGCRLVGLRFHRATHELKAFLGRNQIPYHFTDAAYEGEAKPILEAANAVHANLPVVIFPDGTALETPSTTALATKLGLHTHATAPFYDLAIVGGGPAGLAAAVYGASEGLSTVLIEREAPGGQAGLSSRIENYLGFPMGLSGADLARRAIDQARRFGVEIITAQEATELCLKENYKTLILGDQSQINCRALLIATGVQYRKLDAEGVDRLNGKGIYYGAAATEAEACRDSDIFIVGGANSAGQAAVFLSQFARKVVMLVRGQSLCATMSSYLIDQIAKTPTIEVRCRTRVVEALGDQKLTGLVIENCDTNERTQVETQGLFVFIGAVPKTDWLGDLIKRDEKGFILAGNELAPLGGRPEGWKEPRPPFLLETNVPGVFVAGDVRCGSVKRVASGVGEGSIAVQFIHRFLGEASA
jgi:thioredoxin reductase (NADPH)